MINPQVICDKSTTLYGSLWFGTNERVLLRRRYPTIASLCVPITTTKGEGYYVEFFYTWLPLGVGVKNVKRI